MQGPRTFMSSELCACTRTGPGLCVQELGRCACTKTWPGRCAQELAGAACTKTGASRTRTGPLRTKASTESQCADPEEQNPSPRGTVSVIDRCCFCLSVMRRWTCPSCGAVSFCLLCGAGLARCPTLGLSVIGRRWAWSISRRCSCPLSDAGLVPYAAPSLVC